MTRKDLACVHEPFGDAFYYGPERLSVRYENDEEARKASGFGDSTYATIFDRLEREGSEDKRVFIKDIIHYLLPPDAKPPQLAPSLMLKRRGIGTQSNGHTTNGSASPSKDTVPFPYGTPAEPGNPTVVPGELLKKFHYTFLIRDPHYSIPSYYRCTIPPLDKVTGFYKFYPSEAGYDEVRRVFDYLVTTGLVGPNFAGDPDDGSVKSAGSDGADSAGSSNGHSDIPDICVIDADDLLDNPKEMIEAYCKTVGLDYDPDMLHWEDEENQRRAKNAFEKWRGFHEDAINSTELRARTHKKAKKTEDEYDREWTQKYGLKGANTIRQCVDANMDTYNYLKQFAISVIPKHHGYDPHDD